MAKRNALGKGLSALIQDAASAPPRPVSIMDEAGEQNSKHVKDISYLPLSALRGGQFQPRQNFDPEKIDALAHSISTTGMIQPILVRPKEGYYEILAGERRFRAAQKAKLHKVPVIIRATSDAEALQIGLIENLQREQLNPIEEASALLQLQEEFQYGQKDIGLLIGKSRAYIANQLRLLNLPNKVQDLIRMGMISSGHGRALVVSSQAEALAQQVIQKNLSVRETEILVAHSPRSQEARRKNKPAPPNPDHIAFEEKLSLQLGLVVKIRHKSSGEGEVKIFYQNLDQLDDIGKKLAQTTRH